MNFAKTNFDGVEYCDRENRPRTVNKIKPG